MKPLALALFFVALWVLLYLALDAVSTFLKRRHDMKVAQQSSATRVAVEALHAQQRIHEITVAGWESMMEVVVAALGNWGQHQVKQERAATHRRQTEQ